MARTRDRAFALFGAVLFLVTSSALTIAVVYSMVQDSHKKQDLGATSTPAEKTTEAKVDDNKTTPTGKLEGTKLVNWTGRATVTKLEHTDSVVGTGDEVKSGATVTAHYTGAYASDGTIFQSSHDQPGDKPIEFSLSGVIPGWTQGVPGMKVGGTRRLIIPGNLAYGEAPAGYTQGSTARPMGPLVFDIEIVAVKNP